ncbi:hypothetical protein GLOTRDRAFT_101210, partial [Gloeophyllum trabeum ATCC 11539]
MLKSNVFRSPRIVPPRHKPTRPPKPDPGVGDLWLRTADLSPANALLFQHGDFASELAFCEMFMLRIPDPDPSKFFAELDTYCLYAAISVPVDSGVPSRHRASPVAIVEKWVGCREVQDSPGWTHWVPGKAQRFIESRSDA